MSRGLIAFSFASALVFSSTVQCSSRLKGDLSLKIFYSGLNVGRIFWGDSDQTVTEGNSSEPGVDKARIAVVGGLLAGSMVAIHVYQQSGWWADNRAPFHFQEDLVYGLWVDKIGHFYGAAVLGFTIERSLEWANVPPLSSLWIGSGGALLFQTYVEIEDGFSRWGFDRVDFAFDVMGAAWPIARYYVPSLQNFDLKLSYHSSPLLGSAGGAGFAGQKHLIIDDYEGQTYWLSIKMKNILPQPLRSSWPEFLCLAVGYGARNIAGSHPYPVVLIAPDIDITKVIPRSSPFLKTLGEALNFIHMPMPAVQVSPGAIWYGIYF